MTKRTAIIGFGDQARVVSDIFRLTGNWDQIACFVDLVPKPEHERAWESVPVFPSFDAFLSALPDISGFIVALGAPLRRRDLFEKLFSCGLSPVSALHPGATVARSAVLGCGTTVCAGAVIGVDVIIGNDVIVNTCASVDHDCLISDHVNIGPGTTIAGRVRVGEASIIGAGATILDEISIGCGATVAAGAVVINDVEPGKTVMGVPARAKQ